MKSAFVASRLRRDREPILGLAENSSFGMWRSLVAHLTGGQGVAGSNPVIPTIYFRSIPVTWVTVHSGDIGNTFDPNGFSIRSSPACLVAKTAQRRTA